MAENIKHSVAELIGGTPLVELRNLEKELGLKARLIVKLERFNPGGSVKDRVGLALIDDAEAGAYRPEHRNHRADERKHRRGTRTRGGCERLQTYHRDA